MNVKNQIRCYNSNCRNNIERKCNKDLITVGWKTSGEFCCGERVGYPVCEDYKGIWHDGDD